MAEPARFAGVDDVAARLGFELSEQQRTAAAFLLPSATALIAVAAGKDDAWATALTPVPQVLRLVCVEAVVRVIANPEALASVTEQQGDQRLTKSWTPGETGELCLTDKEGDLVRSALAGGKTSGSARLPSLVDDLPLDPAVTNWSTVR